MARPRSSETFLLWGKTVMIRVGGKPIPRRETCDDINWSLEEHDSQSCLLVKWEG